MNDDLIKDDNGNGNGNGLKAVNSQAEAILSLRGISKDYRQGRSIIEVLKNVNLDVYRGEMVAIIGASGSGKSTLLHIAGLLDEADSGTVQIAGGDIRQSHNLKDAHKVRLNHIGFIYQHHHLLRDFNARENTAIPLLIKGGDKKLALEKAESILNDVGLGNRLYNMPGELSGGEMQRVAIARSIINEPDIILADEPTGNLDPHASGEIFELFLSQARTRGAAVVMVTHNMGLASKMDRSYELDYNLSQKDSL